MTSPEKRHFSGLDGLRGVAAVVVVIRHSLEGVALPMDVWRKIAYSPAEVLVNAQGAVQIFFVLSGWVLAMSLSRNRERYDVAQFYVKRVFRIHPPYMFAVLFAWAASQLYASIRPGFGLSILMAYFTEVNVTPLQVLASLSFPGTANKLLPVGWSLEVEMIFSLLMPLLVIAVRPLRGVPLVLVAISMLFLPVEFHIAWYALDFVLGMLAFRERATIGRLLDALPIWGRAGVVLAGLVLLCAPPALRASSGTDNEFFMAGFFPPDIATMALGATVLVVSAAMMPAVERVLSSPPCRFLGRISYSLYLLHYTIILLVASFSMRGAWKLGAFPFVGSVLVISLLLSVPTYRFVERPSIALGNRICRRLAARLGTGAAESHAGDPS